MVAFVTGLTTGGLSCLAVQGGLLASSLAHQIEQDYLEQSAQRSKHIKKNQLRPRSSTALPIHLFLLAKIVAYTLLGALLGWLGSFLALSPVTRAILMIVIGVFMLGKALRMLNIHPIFRYFSIEPPKFLTRYIRRTSKGTDTFTPLFLGALTVFIPCGVTQAMMAAALATSSPLTGAAMMLAEGGRAPRWKGDGSELFFLAPDGTLMSSTLDTRSSMRPAAPTERFKTPIFSLDNNHPYAVASNGQRFLIPVPLNPPGPAPITVLLNWTARLKR